MVTASLTVPDDYRVERHELAGDTPRLRFEVISARSGACVSSVRVRRWAGRWAVQPSPAGHVAAGGVIRDPDEAQAMAYALNEAAHAARRGNEGGRP
jgi:hypothetical protein